MMKKQIHASSPKVVTDKPEPYAFPVGAKYISEGIQYTVRRAYNESSTDMRLVYSETNQEEIRLLTSLQAEAEKKGFSVIYTPKK